MNPATKKPYVVYEEHGVQKLDAGPISSELQSKYLAPQYMSANLVNGDGIDPNPWLNADSYAMFALGE